MARHGGKEAARLRAITYLAPGIPLELFRLVTDHLARSLGREIELSSEARTSGPMHGEVDPFGADQADIGFLCSPSYLYLRAKQEPSVELVPAGFVFRDPRNEDRPVYFSEAVVRADHPAREFSDLAGGAWGFNDECSLSGYFSALQKLSELGRGDGFFSRHVRTGSHQASIEALLAREIDGAAIDSTVLAILRSERPELDVELRILESWGPFPIQPIVVRAGLDRDLAARIADALLALEPDPDRHFGLVRLEIIDDSAYAEERRALCSLGEIESLPSTPPQKSSS